MTAKTAILKTLQDYGGKKATHTSIDNDETS